MIQLEKVDKFVFALRVWILKWRNILSAYCVGVISSIIVNVITNDNAMTLQYLVKYIKNHGPLFILFLFNIFVLLFIWIGELGLLFYCKKRRWERLLAKLAKERTSSSIAPFSSSVISWNENLTLQLCPDLLKGWEIDNIELRWASGGHFFAFQTEDQNKYETFRENNKDKRWYQNDCISVRLTTNPVCFTDTPKLILEAQKCKYSQVQFTNHFIATDHARRTNSLMSVVRGDIHFANVFVIHAVIITSDGKALATLSSTKKDYFGGMWSFSIEEQLRGEDLESKDVCKRASAWMRRALWEELGIDETAYLAENIRVLSVFIEGHNLNCGLCCVVTLSIDSSMLSDILSAKPRPDTEFTDYKFYSIDESVELLRHPDIPLHPTTEYRLFIALCYLLTPPQLAKKLFRQPQEDYS